MKAANAPPSSAAAGGAITAPGPAWPQLSHLRGVGELNAKGGEDALAAGRGAEFPARRAGDVGTTRLTEYFGHIGVWRHGVVSAEPQDRYPRHRMGSARDERATDPFARVQTGKRPEHSPALCPVAHTVALVG